MKVVTIETVIIENSTTISAAQVVHELTMDKLQREERLTERYIQFEKGKQNYDRTHYVPRFNGIEW